MKSKVIILVTIFYIFLTSCTSQKDTAGKTVGSETTNAISILSLDGKNANSARIYWVTPTPYWFNNLKNRDSLWIIRLIADTNGQLYDLPELTWKSQIFIHWQDQSISISELPKLGDSLILKQSAMIRGAISGKPLPEQVCLSGTWICSKVNQLTGDYSITGIPEGLYQLVGERIDSIGITKIVMLGSIQVSDADTLSVMVEAKFERISILNFNDSVNSKSPLSRDLGFDLGYGYFVFGGDIDVQIPSGVDSIKPYIGNFLEMDSGRSDLAFHALLQTGTDFHYFHVGAKFDSSISFRQADSVQFLAKGDCDAEIKFFENDEVNLAATYRFQLDSNWRQYRISIMDFAIKSNVPSDTLYSWDTIHRDFNHVVFASFGNCKDFWVDDLEIIGASIDELIQ